MDLSRGYITTIIDEDRFNEAVRSGIDQSFIEDDECRSVYNYISRHYQDYKATPSRTAVKRAFPNFDFADYKEPLEFFIEQIKENFRRNVLEEALLEVHRTYTQDSKKASTILRDALTKLTVTQKSFQDLDLAKTAPDRIESYNIRKENPGADGILSGWDKIDYYTLGWHPEEFILLVGEKYKGKSWLMLWLAYQAILQGERVLFVTKEMSQYAMARRFDAIFSGISFDSLRRGTLSEVEEKRYLTRMNEFNDSTFKIVLARNGVDTIDDIGQKAVETDATIVFGDAIYLFNADNNQSLTGEVQRRMAISQKCKSIAKTLGVPFIASTQGGRKKAKNEGPHLDRIEWSNAFSQDADVVMYLERDDIDKELNRLWLHLLKTRDGDIGAVAVKTDFQYTQFPQDSASLEPSVNIDIDDEESMFDAP